jgi:hypothetical protein
MNMIIENKCTDICIQSQHQCGVRSSDAENLENVPYGSMPVWEGDFVVRDRMECIEW